MEVEAVEEGKLGADPGGGRRTDGRGRQYADCGDGRGRRGRHRPRRPLGAAPPRPRPSRWSKARRRCPARPRSRPSRRPPIAPLADAAPGEGVGRDEVRPQSARRCATRWRLEMRADDRRVPDRRGGRAVSGRLQDQPGPARRVRSEAASSTRRLPSTGSPAWRWVRRWTGCKPIVEFMTFNFAMQAIDHIINSGVQDPLYVGGADGLPDRVPRRRTAPRPGWAAQHSQDAMRAGTRIARA